MTMLFYNHGYSFFYLTLFFALVSCSTNSTSTSTSSELNTDGTFSQAGLDGININSFNQFKDSLYVSTGKGLYKLVPKKNGDSWIPLGLQQENIVDIVFLPNGKLLAAVRLAVVNKGEPTLFLSVDSAQSWQPWTNNYGGETGEYTNVASLATLIKPSDTLFAHGGPLAIARSLNGGENWDLVNGTWDSFGGAPQFVYVDPNHIETLWAGGGNPLEQAYLLRSTNNGASWTQLTTPGCIISFDIVVHPDYMKTIIIGCSGLSSQNSIRKSNNGGENWEIVLENIDARNLTHSTRNPEVVYASGRTPSGTLFFAASADFGDTWEMVEMKNGPAGIRVNDTVSVMVEGNEVLYLGTNQGVYSYTFEE